MRSICVNSTQEIDLSFKNANVIITAGRGIQVFENLNKIEAFSVCFKL